MTTSLNKTSAFLFILLAAAAVSFYLMREKERDEKTAWRGRFEEALNAQKKLEADLEALQKSNASLEEKIREQETRISLISDELAKEKDSRQKAEEAASAKEAEVAYLTARMKEAQSEQADLAARLEKQYADYVEMKAHLGSLLKSKQELEKKAQELAENGPISLGTIVVRQNNP